MLSAVAFSALMAVVSASVALERRATYSGLATFNDYAAQSNTGRPIQKGCFCCCSLTFVVCGPKTGVSGTYGAAIGDLSPNIWSGAKCSGSIDYSEWSVFRT